MMYVCLCVRFRVTSNIRRKPSTCRQSYSRVTNLRTIVSLDPSFSIRRKNDYDCFLIKNNWAIRVRWYLEIPWIQIYSAITFILRLFSKLLSKGLLFLYSNLIQKRFYSLLIQNFVCCYLKKKLRRIRQLTTVRDLYWTINGNFDWLRVRVRVVWHWPEWHSWQSLATILSFPMNDQGPRCLTVLSIIRQAS